MAIQDYVYSIQDDFVINHKVDPTILQEEIVVSTITTEVHHIYVNLEQDECQVWFFDALTGPEEIELDAIIAAHTGELSGGFTPGEVGDFDGGQGDISIYFGDHSDVSLFRVTEKPWETITRFIFRGTNQLGTPVGVKAVWRSKDEDPNKQGGFRLYDVTNGNVIFEWDGFHNYGWMIGAQNVTTGWPIGEAILELQGQKDDGEWYLSSFMIQFSGTIVDNM